MEFTLREQIRKKWDGSQCCHPRIEKVSYYTSDTGYYACKACGLLMEEKDIQTSDNNEKVVDLSQFEFSFQK